MIGAKNLPASRRASRQIFVLQSPCAGFSRRAASESVDADSRVFETEVECERRFWSSVEKNFWLSLFGAGALQLWLLSG